MRPSELVTLKRDTVERSIETISNRINQLGLTERRCSSMARRAPITRFWCELPGVDDPARVKEIMRHHRAVWRSRA